MSVDAMETEAYEYFSSLSVLSKHFLALQDDAREAYGNDKWLALTDSEKEALINSYIVPSTIEDEYRDSDDLPQPPEVFPVHKVPCGEKIIVEDSGRTWVDEHSGPFSWANRSQQDLTIFGMDDDTLEKKPVRPPRKQRSRSPDSGNSLGKSSGKSLGKSPGKSEMTAQDEIFQKFGIQFGAEQNDDEEEETEDSSGPLLPNPDPKIEQSYVNTEILPTSEIDEMDRKLDHMTLIGESSTDDIDIEIRHSYGTSPPSDLGSRNSKHNLGTTLTTTSSAKTKATAKNENNISTKESHSDATENNFTNSNTSATDMSNNVIDFGYTSSDMGTPTVTSSSGGVVDVQPISIPYPEFLEADEEDANPPVESKTGFDFLDNW